MAKQNTAKSAMNYGIRIKLQLGFLVVLLLTLLVGSVGYYGITMINTGAEELGAHWLNASNSFAKVVEELKILVARCCQDLRCVPMQQII